ncbi:hypothetical protein ACS0TY_017563 [Phlomoides rotata]
MSLAFDPTKSPHYKVVCVYFGLNNAFEFVVYSSKTRSWSWRKCAESFTARGVYWNGAIHWVSLRSVLEWSNPLGQLKE